MFGSNSLIPLFIRLCGDLSTYMKLCKNRHPISIPNFIFLSPLLESVDFTGFVWFVRLVMYQFMYQFFGTWYFFGSKFWLCTNHVPI